MNTNVPRLEKKWFLFGSGALVFLIIIGIIGYGIGINQAEDKSNMLQAEEMINNAPFDRPGLVQLGPEEYRATIVAFASGFEPNVIEIPPGSTVHFEIASKDVTHSYAIMDTMINLKVIPGQVSTYSYTFDQPGEFKVQCTEYCGLGHDLMQGKIIVADLAP